MLYYIMSVLAAVGCAGNFAITKVYEKRMGSGIRAGIVFNIFVGLFTSIIFFALSGFRWECTAFSLIIAFLYTLFIGAYTVIGFRIMSMGSMTVYAVFLMLGGAVIPYLYGVIFLNEAVNLPKVFALVLVVCAVLLNLLDEKGKKQSLPLILLCFAVFFLNGGVSVVSKLHQIETDYATVSANAFVVLKSIIRCLFFAVLLLFFRKNSRVEQTKTLDAKMIVVMIASAVLSGVSYVLQLVCASYMPASVLYPLVTGGTIVFTSVLDRACFGQHLKRRSVISIFICMVSFVLFVI